MKHPVHIWIVLLLLCVLLTLAVSKHNHYSLKQQQCSNYQQEKLDRSNEIGSNGFRFSYQDQEAGTIRLIGDVNDVLRGHVSHAASQTFWSSKGIIGFGAGAIGSLTGMGEAIFANGYVYVRTTDNQTHNYFETISHDNFLSPFSMYVSQGSMADGVATYSSAGTGKSAKSQTMLQLYTSIYESVGGRPFCFHAFTKFEHMSAIAISKAPIYNEPLFGDLANSYYTKPPFNLTNEYGLVFGCVANFSTVDDPILRSKLKKALYVNPMDEGSATELQVHSHVLTLCPSVDALEEITPASVLGAYHLLSNAQVTDMDAKVFIIDSAEDLVEVVPSFTKNG